MISSDDEPKPKNRTFKLRALAAKRCNTCEDTLQDCSCAPEDVTELRRQWSCINDTLNDRKFRSQQKALSDVFEFISERISGPVEAVSPQAWMIMMLKWGELRGKTEYMNGEVGPAPQTAATFFNLFVTVLKTRFQFDLCQHHPILARFPRKWMRNIAQEKLYTRRQAKYFTKEDVRAYVNLFRNHQGTENQIYYAKMAEVVLLISIMFAGCRLGELLAIAAGQVKFMTIDDKIAITMAPGGSKTDFANQKTTCIAFSELEDEELCPVKAFFRWLHFRGIEIEDGELKAPFTKKLFPLFKTNKILETSLFTKKVQLMEQKGQQNLPKFNAHTGRVTVTTLALFSKNEEGRALISPELLEHQYHWQRGTETLSNYLGFNSTFAEGGFHSQISKIRNEGLENLINEDAVKRFSLGLIDKDKLSCAFSRLSNKD